MKKFIVSINFSHESFGGYDHNDGTKDYKVTARNEKSARKKAMKIADEESGREKRIVGVESV